MCIIRLEKFFLQTRGRETSTFCPRTPSKRVPAREQRVGPLPGRPHHFGEIRSGCSGILPRPRAGAPRIWKAPDRTQIYQPAAWVRENAL